MVDVLVESTVTDEAKSDEPKEEENNSEESKSEENKVNDEETDKDAMNNENEVSFMFKKCAVSQKYLLENFYPCE